MHFPQQPESVSGDWGFGGAICVDVVKTLHSWFGTPVVGTLRSHLQSAGTVQLKRCAFGQFNRGGACSP